MQHSDVKAFLLKRATEIQEELVGMRRSLHRIPEVEFEEHKTAALLKEKLSELGLDPATGLGGTGLSALITGTVPKTGAASEQKTLLLRSDMDALPVTELTGLPYASETPGVMHACGHDAHMTMIYGAAKMLCELAPEFSGAVRILYQPAEELNRGAHAVRETGILNEPPITAVLGTHVWPDIPSGSYGVLTGPCMAAPGFFDLHVRGRGGHGSQPHRSIDPIRICNEIYNAFSALPVQHFSALEPVVLSVTRFQGGYTSNVFPDTCELSGTVRSYDPEIRLRLPELMEQTAKSICARYGADCDFVCRSPVAAVRNDASLAELVRRSAADLLGPDVLFEGVQPSMVAEDFSVYLENAPGVFVWTGVRNPACGAEYALHNPHFTLDEDVLGRTSALLAYTAYRYLTA